MNSKHDNFTIFLKMYGNFSMVVAYTNSYRNTDFYFKNRVKADLKVHGTKNFGVAVFHQNPKIYDVWSMCRLCLVSERSFLHDLWPFLKKKRKKVKKIQSGIFGLFLTAMASRLSGIDSSNISRHLSQKKPKKYWKREEWKRA